MTPPVRKLFGTDGVRGEANQYPMTSETALALGRAIAITSRSGRHRHRIVVGKDTRLSCYMLEMAIASGICSAGADVLLVGPLPTPAIAFLTRSMRADGGVMISASHNAYQDNGIKFFARDGFKLPDEVEAEMERFVLEDHHFDWRPTKRSVGRAFRVEDARGRYIVYIKDAFPAAMEMDGVSMVVDCANGAAYKVAPTVFQELGAKVHTLGANPDGRNINHRCGSLHPQHMCKSVVSRGAALGIALDGDADRVAVCDEHGELVDGDQIMAICGADRLARRELPKKTVVATVMSNLGLDRAIEGAGGKVVRTQVGDRYVVERMRAGGFALGGEKSGHLINFDFSTTGDGIIAAINLIEVMLRTGKPLSELKQIMPVFPQKLVSVRVKHRRPVEDIAAVTKQIAALAKEFGREGRAVVRFSGTEPVARVMVEGPAEERVSWWADTIADTLERELSHPTR